MAQSANAVKSEPTLSSIFSRGLLKENPALRQMLGLCPTLAVTTAVTNGLGSGMATTFVLICSGVVVLLLRKVIPSKVRIPAYIVVIASFVTIIQLLIKVFIYCLSCYWELVYSTSKELSQRCIKASKAASKSHSVLICV